MIRRRAIKAVALGAAAGAAGTTAGAAVIFRDPHRRHRLERSVRVWKLTARRGAHWVTLKVRGRGADEARRARLEEQFAIRSAEDVAQVLGHMKGAVMKAGQMISFIAEGLPPEAQAALAALQADVAPMSPALAESVIREELGASPEKLFLDWEPVPVAAASIGQVHRAVLRDGRIVAVKVQYPGVDKAIKSDLANAELLYTLFSQFSLRNLDVRSLVDELRERMADELDYRLEARSQMEFYELFEGHPFIHIPAVVEECSARRVLTSEWVDGWRWDDFLEQADSNTKQTAAEVLMRFAQNCVYKHGRFNGDPHPGNYRFHSDGSVTFLDFGLVKRWTHEEFALLTPTLDAVLADDARGLVDAMVKIGALPADHGLDSRHVFEYVSNPYTPFIPDEFTFTRSWVGDALTKVLDAQGDFRDLFKLLDLPRSYVILDRVVWGLSALLGRLEASGGWRRILAEYREGAPPSTALGQIEAAWQAARGA